MVESFNAGDVHDLVSNTTDDYHYFDPVGGRINGAAAHEAYMRSVLERYPDRRIQMLNCWVAEGAEFAEYRWIGTPADGGEPVEAMWATVVEFQGDRIYRWANYRG